MSQRGKGGRAPVLVLVSLMAVAGVALAQEEETPEERRARWDRGPQTIDVSNYPPEMQARYERFADKCSKCHNLSRPINAEFTTEEWASYLDKMMRKKGSGISKKDKNEIYEFLVYDTTIRKPQLIKRDPESTSAVSDSVKATTEGGEQ